MNQIINDAIIDMINFGILSIRRITGLIYIKEFIDRISTKKYIEEDTVKEMEDRYGVSPNVITWGDYFQTEMASSLTVLSDSEFDRAVDTLKFDMIASSIIFSEKNGQFFQWVNDTYLDIIKQKEMDFTEEEDEIIHLKILMDYFLNLGIANNFTEAEMKWYSDFEEAKVV